MKGAFFLKTWIPQVCPWKQLRFLQEEGFPTACLANVVLEMVQVFSRVDSVSDTSNQCAEHRHIFHVQVLSLNNLELLSNDSQHYKMLPLKKKKNLYYISKEVNIFSPSWLFIR